MATEVDVDAQWFTSTLQNCGVRGDRLERVCKRAREVLRLLDLKCPKGQLAGNEHCRRAAALQMAATEQGAELPKSSLLAACTAKAKQFDLAFNILSMV